MKGDIRGIKIQDLEGKLIATALVILRENDITFFDLIIEESPEEYRGAD